MRPSTRGLPKLAMIPLIPSRCERAWLAVRQIVEGLRFLALGEAIVLRLPALLELLDRLARLVLLDIGEAGLLALELGEGELLGRACRGRARGGRYRARRPGSPRGPGRGANISRPVRDRAWATSRSLPSRMAQRPAFSARTSSALRSWKLRSSRNFSRLKRNRLTPVPRGSTRAGALPAASSARSSREPRGRPRGQRGRRPRAGVGRELLRGHGDAGDRRRAA